MPSIRNRSYDPEKLKKAESKNAENFYKIIEGMEKRKKRTLDVLLKSYRDIQRKEYGNSSAGKSVWTLYKSLYDAFDLIDDAKRDMNNYYPK